MDLTRPVGSQDSKRTKALGETNEIVKGKSMLVMDLTRPVVDKNQHSSAPVVDLTEEDFDKEIEKIKREIDKKKKGLSQKKAASKDKEMIDDEIEKRHERLLHFSIHRFVLSDPGKLGLTMATWPNAKIMKIKGVVPDMTGM